MRIAGVMLLLLVATMASATVARAADPVVLDAERQRVEVIAKASAATVAIFDGPGKSGGSGVLISPDGFALTNFHVVAPCGPAMKCGLPDGRLYDAVIVGIDPVGDVALIQLLGREDFPAAQIGDSDKVRVGDYVFAAGNPFLLADDFTPSVSYGIVSGVRRYQYPAGTLLEYADCIQTDAAINPGNSGGPLFDSEGRLIGVNGRASFEKRGRVNVGVGYSISINQVMRFVSHLKSGRIVDHASLGATASTDEYGVVTVDEVLEGSDADRRGISYGDRILRFAGREIRTANALKNALGVFPPGWRVPIVLSRQGVRRETVVRLPPLHGESELIELVQQQEATPIRPPEGEPDDDQNEPQREPTRRPDRRSAKPAELPPVVADRYESRRGFANYWYNRTTQESLWKTYAGGTAVRPADYNWNVVANLPDGQVVTLLTGERQSTIRTPELESSALFVDDPATQLSPPGSGGFLLAVHLWQRLLDKGLRQFGEVYYLGQLPFGIDGSMADHLVGIYAGVETHFCFSPETGDLVGILLFARDETDPCEIEFFDFEDLPSGRLPRRWLIRHGELVFADLAVADWQFVGEPSPSRPVESN